MHTQSLGGSELASTLASNTAGYTYVIETGEDVTTPRLYYHTGTYTCRDIYLESIKLLSL